MNLLIHDLNSHEYAAVQNRYEGWNILSDSGEIRPCIGCFRCWTSGTGRCAFQDGYANIGELVHEAEEVVVMSRFTYGGFSPFVKNVFDRMIGYVLPEFTAVYGEMHHQKRYPEEKPVTFIIRGHDLSDEDKEKAHRYVRALCRNLRGTVKEVRFEESGVCETAAQPPEHRRSGILAINSSLRGERSNTHILLEKLKASINRPVKTVSLRMDSDYDEIADAISRAEAVILGVPLYVDGLPAQAIRLLETAAEKGAGRGCRLYALANNGLYESRQNSNLLEMIRLWCRENECWYCGGAAIGAGEVIGVLLRAGGAPLWPARNALAAVKTLAERIQSGTRTGDCYADPFLFPRSLYIAIANANWQLLKKKQNRN